MLILQHRIITGSEKVVSQIKTGHDVWSWRKTKASKKLHQNKMNLNQIDSGDEKKIVVFSQHGNHCLSNGCIIYITEPENESIAMIL